MNQERLLKIILGVRSTEKSTRIQAKGQYVFKVAIDSTKTEIKLAVKQLFNAEVESVGIVNVKAKTRRVGAIKGSRKRWKKAYVALKQGYHIQSIADMTPTSASTPTPMLAKAAGGL